MRVLLAIASLSVLPMLARSATAQEVTPVDSVRVPPRWHSGRAGAAEVTPAAFRFDVPAKRGLQDLWKESAGVNQERVACIGGHIENDTVVVDRVSPMHPIDADSMSISARQSIDQCGPPNYEGTVHTHIAHYDGEHPYPSFSGADRGVMDLWWFHWRIDGMFCVLYDETHAHCELQTGGSMMAQHAMTYVDEVKKPVPDR